jgi:hypothetical protein
MMNTLNDPTLHTFLYIIVERAQERAKSVIPYVKSLITEGTDKEIEAYLYELQVSAIGTALSLIDGSIGPTEWEGVKLVHAKTSATLTKDIRTSFTHAEGDYYDRVEGRVENDER